MNLPTVFLRELKVVEIKSIGLLLLAILPGAFVEPDEEQVKKVQGDFQSFEFMPQDPYLT